MRRIAGFASLFLFVVVVVASVALGQERDAERNGDITALKLTLGLPGLGMESDDRLLIAVPLVNRGTKTVQSVRITSITLESSSKLSREASAVVLGDIAPGRHAVFETSFSASKMKSGSRRLLVIEGTFMDERTSNRFTLRKNIIIPMRSGESARLRTATVKADFGVGTSYSDTPSIDERANKEVGPPIPTGTPRGDMQPARPETTVVHGRMAETPNRVFFDQLVREAEAGDDPLLFTKSTQAMVTSSGAFPDASGASSNNVVLYSSNAGVRYSTDGGVSFAGTLTAPGDLNDDGGRNGDNVMIYIPKVDRFVWLMQFKRKPLAGETSATASGPNRYRLAVASPLSTGFLFVPYSGL